MPETRDAQASEPTGALALVAQVVPLLAGLLGLAGYVLVLGATVLWLRLAQAHLPTEVPVSLASHDELIAMGAQALAVWVVLVAVLAGLVAQVLSEERRARHRPVVDLVLGMALAGSILAAEGATRILWVLPGLAVALVAFAILVYRPSGDALWRTLAPAASGGVLVWAVWRLAETQRAVTLAGAAIMLVVVLIAVPELRTRHKRRVGTEDALAKLAAIKKPNPDEERLIADLRQRARPASRRGRLATRLRWAALAAAALLLMGGIAVASQLERKANFRAAFVSLDTGRCVVGTYLGRNDSEVVLGAPSGDYRARVVEIPAERVLELQISDPRTRTVPLYDFPCGRRAIVAPADAPEPFRGPAGPPGPQGERGPRGVPGSASTPSSDPATTPTR
jgi:hypothetical protein